MHNPLHSIFYILYDMLAPAGGLSVLSVLSVRSVLSVPLCTPSVLSVRPLSYILYSLFYITNNFRQCVGLQGVLLDHVGPTLSVGFQPSHALSHSKPTKTSPRPIHGPAMAIPVTGTDYEYETTGHQHTKRTRNIETRT